MSNRSFLSEKGKQKSTETLRDDIRSDAEVELNIVRRPGRDTAAEEVPVLGLNRAVEQQRHRNHGPIVNIARTHPRPHCD
jgi:hypothetical protein